VKRIFKLLGNRLFLVIVLIVIQIVVLALIMRDLTMYRTQFGIVFLVLRLVLVLYVIYRPSDPAYKLAWSILILLIPVFGGIFYLVLGSGQLTRLQLKSLMELPRQNLPVLHHRPKIQQELDTHNLELGNQARYIAQTANYPLYRHTQTLYFPTGEAKFEAMRTRMEQAKQFIFLEYYIIAPGKLWYSLLEILARKAAAGVDVRVIYDDLGCVDTLPFRYDRTLREMGIRCAVFNRLRPFVSLILHHRDHRKICIVDGETGFTGGANIGDEYVNVQERFGHWKDTAIMLEGEAVRNLTVMFLEHWYFLTGERESGESVEAGIQEPSFREEACLPANPKAAASAPGALPSDGFVLPFADGPLSSEHLSENVFLNMIGSARHSVWITTPYLVINYQLKTALTLAAKKGLDVRIITPRIPDKWLVHAITRSHYSHFIEAGVRIWEYTPGFIHAKSILVDGHVGIVGTINMDYRSLYLHFECGVWMCGSSALRDLQQDYSETQALSSEITAADCANFKWYYKVLQIFLRLLEPLM
jgi:cardiolipin synthase